MKNLNNRKAYYYQIVVINGTNHNVIAQLQSQSNNIHQNNHSEIEVIKQENEFLRTEVSSLKNQLEFAQDLLDNVLSKKNRKTKT